MKSDVFNRKFLDSVNYQLFSSGCLWTINADTLSVVSKVAGIMQNGIFVQKIN